MLSKLYKYEFTHLFKIAIWLYAILTISTVFTIVTNSIPYSENIAYQVCVNFVGMFYIFSILALYFGTFIFIGVRFYQSFLTDQAYLTFTLPIKTTSHFNCKLITSFVFALVNMAMIILQIWLVGLLETGASPISLITSSSNITPETIPYTISFLILILVAMLCFILAIYAILTIGAQFKNRFIGSAVVAIILYVAHQILSFTWIVILFVNLGDAVESIFASQGNAIMIKFMLPITLVIFGECLAIYFITRHFFCKKKNLQ